MNILDFLRKATSSDGTVKPRILQKRIDLHRIKTDQNEDNRIRTEQNAAISISAKRRSTVAPHGR